LSDPQALHAYLRDIQYIHDTGAGVKETSYYPALSNLFNAVGKELQPAVQCIITIKNQGAGLPDGGFFIAGEVQPDSNAQWGTGQMPARGTTEVKGADEDVLLIAQTDQVQRYCGRYGQVLVTNLRDFLLVARNLDGECIPLERFSLVPDAATLWSAVPQKLAKELGERFEDYLRRVMLRASPITTPRDLAWLLASYAREALARTMATENPALNEVRSVLEDALSMRFVGVKGKHFFRSTLVQTLFYGVFSAWVLWSKEHPPTSQARFHWHEAAWKLQVPMVRALFERLAGPSTLGPLKLVEVLDWTSDALNRVDRASFFTAFEESHAVQYFYEPFLEAYDPELRKELGVWYTPPEVVEYMVDRVDTVLRTELALPDGLADPNVYVLDPCCGTGSYLMAVLRRIGQTLAQKGDDTLLGYDLKHAAMERVFGFEILPAPFVVAHLQLGLLLQGYGVPFSEERAERAAIYLTNALTGWESSATPRQRSFWPELDKERDAAENIKLDKPILVVLGNPPYNGYAGLAVDEERGLSNAYRTVVQAPPPQGQGLNDLYVRFYRMAERRIVEETGRGIVCLISNYSWLDGRSFTGMRERYLEVFDHVWVDSLNGDKYRTGKVTPWGDPDPSVFSTPFTPEGIQVGTAIALLVRKDNHRPTDTVAFRNLWGKTKRQQLMQTEHPTDSSYEQLVPSLGLGLPFAPTSVAADYLSWPLLPQLFPKSFPGIQPSRDAVVVDIDRARLAQRMEHYFDPRVTDAEIGRIAPRAMEKTARFDPKTTRQQLLKRGFLPKNVVPYLYRPFDVRWLYWEPETKLLDEKRADYVPHVFIDNLWLGAAQQNRKDFDPPLVTRLCASRHVIERGANLFPMWLRSTHWPGLFSEDTLVDGADGRTPNLATTALEYLTSIGESETLDRLFHHVLAILYAPQYRNENAGALRRDWPRIPLPMSGDVLNASAGIGMQVARLLDVATPVESVTAGSVRPDLVLLGRLTSLTGSAIDPDAGVGLMREEGRRAARRRQPEESGCGNAAGLRCGCGRRHAGD